MRREKKQEEQNKQQLEAEKQKMENSWWGTVKYCGGTLGLVIAGAVAILVLDSCLQEDDAKRILVQRR